MRIITKARHTEIPQELRDYAEKKVGDKCVPYLGNHEDAVVIDIEFDDQFGPKGGEDKRVDITISLPHQHQPLHIEESDTTFKEAVDKAVDRLDQPLAKYKETLT